MIKIRLSRSGAKNDPFYKIVAIESKLKRDGKILDTIGYWQPRKNEKKLDKDKLAKWVGQGAVVTKAVDKLFKP